MNNWEKLCENIVPLIKGDIDEKTFHDSFGAYLKTIFNWNDSDIKNEGRIKVASGKGRADIILTGSDFYLIIEFKKPKIELSDDDAFQLWSYMRMFKNKCRYGLLVGNKIQAVYEDDGNMKKSTFIKYNKNNSDGIRIGEILDKNVCSDAKLSEYFIEIVNREQKEDEDDDDGKNNGDTETVNFKAFFKNKIIPFFENKGYKMNYNDKYFSFASRRNQITFGILFYSKDNKYYFKWGTVNEQRINLKSKLKSIQVKYKDAYEDPETTAENNYAITIPLDQNNILEYAYKIVKDTAGIVGYSLP